MNFEYEYRSDIYRDFREINGNDVYGKIRFFEKHRRHWELLNIYERFEMLASYTDALFLAENFIRHKEYAATLLEMSIVEGFQYLEETDVYLRTLEQYCISCFKTGDLEKSLKLATQLHLISTDKKQATQILKKILLKKRPKWVLNLYASSFLIFAVWTIFTLVHLLVLEPFYPTMALIFNGFNQAIILAGIFLILTASSGNFIYVGRALKKLKAKS